MKAKIKSRSTNQGCLGKIFFDVPVYRLTKLEYETRQDQSVEEGIAYGGDFAEANYRKHPEERERMVGHLRKSYGGCWQFNEIIGFIRLYFFHTQIRGEYWRVDAKRISRTRNKVFELFDCKVTCEEDIPSESSNSEVFALTMKYLERAQSEPNLVKRYIDTSVFEFIGPHVDWLRLKKVATKLALSGDSGDLHS